MRPETRGIYLNTPNNPTGAVLTREQLQAIAEVAIERDLWVVSDEAYEHLLFDGAQHVSIASLPGMAERTVSVFTFSKSYAMTGWRVGYVVSPPELRAVMGPLLVVLHHARRVPRGADRRARRDRPVRRTRSRRCAARIRSGAIC